MDTINMEQTKATTPFWPCVVHYLLLNAVPVVFLFAGHWSFINEIVLSGFAVGVVFGITSTLLVLIRWGTCNT